RRGWTWLLYKGLGGMWAGAGLRERWLREWSPARGLPLPLRRLNDVPPPPAPSPTRFQVVLLASQMKSCCPAVASVLINSSLPATQVAGVCALASARTGRVAPAALKSCVPAVKGFEAVKVFADANLASAALTLLMLVCKLATSDCLPAVSVLILACKTASADCRAVASVVNAELVARFDTATPLRLAAFTLLSAEPSPEK